MVADLVVEGEDLVLRLSPIEKAEAVHGDVRVPAAAVRAVEVLDDAPGAVHGWKSPGTRIPGLLAMGTYRQGGRKTFAIVHLNTHRGVRVRLEGASYDEWIVGCADPDAVAARITADTRS